MNYNSLDAAIARVEKILDNAKGKSSEQLLEEVRKASAIRAFPERVYFPFNPVLSTWHIVHKLLSGVIAEDRASHIARHLVGAILALRFPEIKVPNFSSVADIEPQSTGDFLIGNTAIQVSVAPMPPVFEKCRHNIQQGFKPFLLVPDSKLIGARQIAEQTCEQQIAVESIESFVSQNINEISTFSKDKLTTSFKDLVILYNQRVDEVETDKSLMIELPSNLQ